jgi:signal recognition particle receptor subunit beta
MVVLNYTGGEINAKIVYYGPGVSGKTTNLEYIHEKTPESGRGKMVSMKTQTDRTLFFDFLPLELGEINGYRTRFLLYTVPGQVYYNATRKLVLKGVDAVVFVADSSAAKLDENLESLRNLEQNLNEHGMTLDEIPWVIQYNKRDLPDAMTVADLDASLNPLRVPTFEAVATAGDGVYETFHTIATMVYGVLKERLERGELAAEPEASVRTPEATVVSRKAEPAAAPRAARQTGRATPGRPARKATAPATPPAVGVMEEDAIGEHEFDHAVESALRESPATPRTAEPRAAPPKRAAAAPPKAAAPEPAAPDPTPATEDDEVFEAVPDSPFDDQLGRVPELDEAAIASDNARDEGPDEFITDPMRQRPARPEPPKAFPRRPIKAETAREKAPEAPPAPTPKAPPARARRTAPQTAPAFKAPAVEAPAPPPPAPLALTPQPASSPTDEPVRVPVRISRAQLERSAPIEIVLELTVDD